MLSPVLRTRLLRWEGATAPGSFLQLEVRLDISQQLLDAAVRAVYARQLSVSPDSAGGLLLLADYLQARSVSHQAPVL